MISLLTRFVILLLAGLALFHLWRANQSRDRWVNAVIAAGFLGRAVVGQLIFWISYARLPIAQGLQMGDGLWFFARDALLYFPTATGLANSGVRAIIEYPTGGASVAFVKVLATSVFLFGRVTSVAVLLNLFCYLGMTAIIVRWSESEPRARLAAAFAICAISLSPAFFLWSLQPLKDTFFQFVVIAFIGACAAWQRAWGTVRPSIPALLITAAAMIVALLAISGVRWYFAFALFIAAIVFLLIIASTFRGRKAAAFAATAVLIVLLSRAFLLGGGPYVPTSIIRVMTPSTAIAEIGRLPSQIVIRIEMARDGFDNAGGGTSIHSGGNMSKLDHALGAAPASDELKTGDGPASSPIRKEGMDSEETAATTAAPSPSNPNTTLPVHASKTTPGALVPSASTPVIASRGPEHAAATSQAGVSGESAGGTQPTANERPNQSVPRVPGSPAPLAPMASRTSTQRSVPLNNPHKEGPRTAATNPPQPAAARETQTAVPVPPARIVPQPLPAGDRPASFLTRVLTGVASVFIPRSAGERLGLFHIGGGHGMLWFTELDTIIFDLIFLGAMAALAIRRSGLLRNPLIWFLFLLTMLAGVPLAYAITNYGTLFRLREMIYIGLALTPLALATSSRRDDVVAAHDVTLAS
jgi:hypothetical protein